MNTVDDYLDEYGTQMSRESYDDVVDKLVSVGLLEAYEDRVEGVDAAIDSLKSSLRIHSPVGLRAARASRLRREARIGMV